MPDSNLHRITVRYQPFGKEYTYLAPKDLPLVEGDKVSVPVRDRVTTAEVAQVGDDNIPEPEFTCKEIIGKIEAHDD